MQQRAIVAIASTVVGARFQHGGITTQRVFAPGLERRRLGLTDSQGETPNSFSMSAIIGCVKPALRNSAKSSGMARSRSGPETSLPLYAR
jgi:hypothetical protein